MLCHKYIAKLQSFVYCQDSNQWLSYVMENFSNCRDTMSQMNFYQYKFFVKFPSNANSIYRKNLSDCEDVMLQINYLDKSLCFSEMSGYLMAKGCDVFEIPVPVIWYLAEKTKFCRDNNDHISHVPL